MIVSVVPRPRELSPELLQDRACAVFDVLRATTTMAAALEAGVAEIRLCESLQAARDAAALVGGRRLLCGEEACLAPPGFDLGNSPGQFNDSLCGATIFMATTNGTRALLAARSAAVVLPGALVNRSAVASALLAAKRDVTLLCAGTQGELATEDLLGAGAVIDAMGAAATCRGDAAIMALELFCAVRSDLPRVLRQCQGGRNLLAVGLEADIDFAARIDALGAVGVALGEPLTVRRYSG